MAKFKSWGVHYDPAMYHGIDHECGCGVSIPFDLQARIPLLEGFRTDEGPQKKDRAGIGIFKCGSCFEYFWFHLSAGVVRFIKPRAPQWPKAKKRHP